MRYNVTYNGTTIETIEVNDALNLSREEFSTARKEVVEVDDFEAFARKWKITFKAAKSIYGNEVVHMVKKRFHIIKRHAPKFFRRWKQGESIVAIARSCHFPPILIARFLLEHMGYSKSDITDCIRNPHKLRIRSDINNELLMKDILEAHSVDFVYSSAADEKSRRLGEQGENMLETWLKKRNISFRTENDLAKDEEHKETHGKTPDILLDKPLIINGMKVQWIESKSLFGTPNEMKRHRTNQFKPYVKLFGKGMVVYWHGYTMDVLRDRDFFVVNKTFFGDSKATKENSKKRDVELENYFVELVLSEK